MFTEFAYGHVISLNLRRLILGSECYQVFFFQVSPLELRLLIFRSKSAIFSRKDVGEDIIAECQAYTTEPDIMHALSVHYEW